MELNAYTRTIRTLLSTNVKYVVPRFQREYSWGKDQVEGLWYDIIYNIRIEEEELTNREYFIGSLVLIGEDKSTELSIVDGQQRLTTITILLSALVQTFKDIRQENIANAIYSTYIEGKDDDNRPFFKLVNENPRPFLQETIQYINKKNTRPKTEEEHQLWHAYSTFYDKLKQRNLLNEFPESKSLGLSKNEAYLELLKKLRDQILSFLKVIYITVSEEEDAYKIFETLNARGMNLSATDLIKNDIFRTLRNTHPDDEAKTKWKKIQEILSSRNYKVNVDVFFRHHWLSKYSFVRESNIYKDFKRLSKLGQFSMTEFLDGLVEESTYYSILTSPQESDWPNQDARGIYLSIKALEMFQIKQVRTLLLALMVQRENGHLKLTDFIHAVRDIEDFHFAYTHICSMRGSIFERKYSSIAQALRNSNNKKKSKIIIDELNDFYRANIPDKNTFTESIFRLKYLKDYTKNRKTIQYIFNKLEVSLHNTNELNFDRISLEHILPQSNRQVSRELLGSIGNLLPLDKGLNQRADTKSFRQKVKFFQQSELKIVKEFVSEKGRYTDWTIKDIEARTAAIAEEYYDRILHHVTAGVAETTK